MVSNSAAPSVTILRQSLRDEVAATSLRHVSRQVGLTAAELQRFIDGRDALAATRRRAERWFVLHGPGRAPSGLTAESAGAVLRVMVQDVPAARHRATLEALVKSLEDAYRTARRPEPPWLAEVRAQLGGEAAADAVPRPE